MRIKDRKLLETLGVRVLKRNSLPLRVIVRLSMDRRHEGGRWVEGIVLVEPSVRRFDSIGSQYEDINCMQCATKAGDKSVR
jgi:hypothetical protein